MGNQTTQKQGKRWKKIANCVVNKNLSIVRVICKCNELLKRYAMYYWKINNKYCGKTFSCLEGIWVYTKILKVLCDMAIFIKNFVEKFLTFWCGLVIMPRSMLVNFDVDRHEIYVKIHLYICLYSQIDRFFTQFQKIKN